MTEKDKIKQYLEYKQISKYKFYQQTGLSAGFLDSGSSIGVDKARIIINTYPDINLSWLIMGEGPMLRDEELSEDAQMPIEKDSNVGQCSPIKDSIDSICEAASGSNIEVIRELMTKITEQAIEIGRLRERISLIDSDIKNGGGGILPPPTKTNPPKTNPPAALAVTLPDPPPQSPVVESTSILAAGKSAHSPRKFR